MRSAAYWLSLIVVFMIPFEKVIAFGGQGAPTLVKFVGLFVAAFWVATVFVTDRIRKPRPFHLVAILFVLWNIATIWWSVDVDRSIHRVITYVQLLGLILLMWDLYITPEAVRAALQAYVLGAYVSAVGTIVNYLKGVTAHNYIIRYSATGFNENEVSLVMAVGLPISWYLATSWNHGNSRTLLRLLNYLYVPTGLLAILLTASRGGLLSTVPALFFMAATLGRVRPVSRVLISCAMIVALLAVHSLVPESSYERLAETDDQIAAGDLTGRTVIWQQGIEVLLERPFLGVGAGAFQSAVEIQRAAHNAYLSILVDVGLLGFLLFFSMLAMALINAMQQARWEAGLWVTLLMTWAIGVSALSLEYSKITWLLLSLPIVSANVHWWSQLPQGRQQAWAHPHVG